MYQIHCAFIVYAFRDEEIDTPPQNHLISLLSTREKLNTMMSVTVS